MNHKPSVRSLFAPNRGSTHRASSVSTVKRTSSITNAIRTASVGTAFVGNSRFHIALRTSNDGDEDSNQNVKPSEVVAKESLAKEGANRHSLVDKEGANRHSLVEKEAAKENSNVKKSPFLSRRSPFVTRRAKKNANSPDNKGSDDAGNSSLNTPSPKEDSKSEDRLSVSELFAVYSRITRRKLSKQDGGRAGHGTWGYRASNAKPRPTVLDGHSPFSTLPRNFANPTLQDLDETLPSPTDELQLMSYVYAKRLKLRKQKEELKRIHSMLEDLENDFMGSKENNTFIERYMEVRVKKDYMLSPGNPESTVEKEDTIKVFGYLGHNTWRILGPHCKGYCQKNNVLNPRIRSQNQVADVDIVCNACNKITVPLIGSVPTSILHMRNANQNSPG
ncbi:hypothetical protein ACHWQZ_G011987 [Mnemiopsis leidyi]